ncbi:HAD family phosphatase [Brevibacterium casei]|uniref:HAD family phosphatase n=1 Tax=Brevibacterium casei TaxID=33889 RepID=A0A7T9YR62_9MICO|nr:HAD family phosphatase [Brevibacterium casei]QPS34434.1 HAD family phosphatase [Brevibacterium casei]QQT70013.1 HAD family phosphatase [Brevibacterium casei]
MSDVPTTVVFDLGQVLVGWDQTGPLSDEMSRAEWEEFAAAADFASLNVSADNGATVAEVVDRAARVDPRHGEIVSRYYERFEHSLTGPIPGMADIVAELKDAGVRLLGLSNWSAETIHHAPVAAPAISELEDIVVSGREKLIKPDPAIFDLLLSRFGLDPGRTVFVDDLEANVEAARRLGIIGIVFTGADDLRTELESLGVLDAPSGPVAGERTAPGGSPRR